jgi:CheY-like chemotaxis protein
VLEKSTALGGSAGLQSTSEHGTVFYFELPYDPCIEGSSSQGESAAPTCSRSPGSGTVRGRLNSSLNSSLDSSLGVNTHSTAAGATSSTSATTAAAVSFGTVSDASAFERDVELGHCSEPACMNTAMVSTNTSTTAAAAATSTAAAAATVETSACEAVCVSSAVELRTPGASPKRATSLQQQQQQQDGYSPLYTRSSTSPCTSDAPSCKQLGHVLLVDDCASIRKHLARVLRSEGYKVLQVVALVVCSGASQAALVFCGKSTACSA